MAAGPSVSLLLAAIGAVAVGALLPATPLARTLGFQPLPGSFCLALALMITCYLALLETGTLVLPHRARRPGDPAPQPRLPPAAPRRPLHHRRQPSLPGKALSLPRARARQLSLPASTWLRQRGVEKRNDEPGVA